MEYFNKKFNHVHFESIDSTQIYARHSLPNLRNTPVLISADAQTHGIGQHHRTWQSPPGNIYASLVVDWPAHKQNLVFNITQITTLTIAQVIDEILLPYNTQSNIKWINDLMVGGRKISGVLCENYIEPQGGSKVIIGFGLNVNMTAQQCDNVDQPITSLSIQTNKAWDAQTILLKITNQLIQNLNDLIANDFSPFKALIEARMMHLNSQITIATDKDQHRGEFVGLSDRGELLLQTSDGLQRFHNGRITQQ